MVAGATAFFALFDVVITSFSVFSLFIVVCHISMFMWPGIYALSLDHNLNDFLGIFLDRGRKRGGGSRDAGPDTPCAGERVTPAPDSIVKFRLPSKGSRGKTSVPPTLTVRTAGPYSPAPVTGSCRDPVIQKKLHFRPGDAGAVPAGSDPGSKPAGETVRQTHPGPDHRFRSEGVRD